MHPFRQVMIILPILVPLQAFVKGITKSPFVQFLTDPQSSLDGVLPSLLFIEAAYPASPWVVFAVAAECLVNLIHEPQCQMLEFLAPGLLIKAEKVADRESIGP